MTLLGQGFGDGSATSFDIPGGDPDLSGNELALLVTVDGKPSKVYQTDGSETTSVDFPTAPADGAIINFYSIPASDDRARYHKIESLDFNAVLEEAVQDIDLTVEGVALGDIVHVTPHEDLGGALVVFCAWVNAADSVTVRFAAIDAASSGNVDLAATDANFSITVVPNR